MTALDPVTNVRKIVDLSLLLSADTETFPGDPHPRIEILGTIEKNGTNTARIVLNTHTGTHVDVPYHLLERGKSVDKLPLGAFCGIALTYDTSHKAVGSRICPEDLDPSETLRIGEIALFYTGSKDPKLHGRAISCFSCFDTTLADWLIERRVKAVGIDSLSVDTIDSFNYEVHKKLLSNNVVIFENLSNNLKLLLGKRVLFFGMPLKLERAEASPIRAFALC